MRIEGFPLRWLSIVILATLSLTGPVRAACPGENWSCSQLAGYQCLDVCDYCSWEFSQEICFSWECWFGTVYYIVITDSNGDPGGPCYVCGSIQAHECWQYPE